MQNSSLQNQTLIVLDSETCSLAGGILEIGFIEYTCLEELLQQKKKDFLEKSVVSRHKNPFPIDPFAFTVHGITEEAVKDKEFYSPVPDFYSKIKNLPEEMEDLILIGHNVSTFDQKVLTLSPQHPCIDTMVLARVLAKFGALTHEGNNKLDTLVSVYCSKEKAHLLDFHGAVTDNWKTIVFLKFLLNSCLKGAKIEELIDLSLPLPDRKKDAEEPNRRSITEKQKKFLFNAIQKRQER